MSQIFRRACLESDPRNRNKYFNLSKGKEGKGPWNKGKSPKMGEDWQFIDNPLERVRQADGLRDEKAKGTVCTEKSVQKHNKSLSAKRKEKVDKATLPQNGVMSWSVYEDGVVTKFKHGQSEKLIVKSQK